jgi:hypothetical protein
MTVKTRLDKVVPFIQRVLQKKLVPMIHGSPAIGKSDIVRQIAEQYHLKVIDVRLSTYDPADMNGLPSTGTNGARSISKYIPFDVFPLVGDKVPEGYKGWIVFLDELPSAAPAVQAAAFKFILDRMVGQDPLHERAFIVGAGNMEDDGGIVNPLPTPLQSRLINFEVYTDLTCFMKYALSKAVDYRISAFLEFKPEFVHHFKADHDDYTFPAPRTWMFLDKLIKGSSVSNDDLPLVAGAIGGPVAHEFLAFCAIFDDVPKIADIIAKPDTTKCPASDENPSLLYAIAGSLAQHASKDNIDKLITYIERMDMEFQVITLRQIIGRKSELGAHKALDGWIKRNSSELWH